MSEMLSTSLLITIVFLTLILPFSIKKIEENLEAFLFVMGISAATISNVWTLHLVKDAFKEPLPITAMVIIVGVVFSLIRNKIKIFLDFLKKHLGATGTVFALVAVLGLSSSIITAIIAALILSEIVTQLKFTREYEVKLTVMACFAIGFGAILTPLGEPLSTILVSKLKGPPHNANFFYLLKEFGLWIIPGVLICSGFAAKGASVSETNQDGLRELQSENRMEIVIRGLKVYLFVMALTFLGAGLTPLAEKFLLTLPVSLLFWINSISAVLDNATLAAAEISPAMTTRQIIYIIMGLVISGGMLIPGNIPNIISASKLGIKSKEWAKVAVPFGAILMLVYFVLLEIFVR